VLVLTGAYAGLLHVPAADALVDTPYGAALSGKLLLFLPLLALGAINLLVLHPRLVRAARPGGSESGWRLFRSIVAGEVVVAMLLLAVTGILAGLPPATTAPGAGEPFREIRSIGELEIALAITPNRAGDNRIELTLTDQEGSPAAVDSVSIMLGHQEMAMDERTIEAREAEPGRWVAEGNALNMAGRWAAMVEVRRPGAEPARAPFDVLVGQAPGAAQPVFSPLLVLREALTPTAMVGGIALVVGLLLLGQSRRWRGARERQVGVALGVTLGLIGTFVAGDALATAYQATRPNPFPPTAESLAAGRTIYIASCASCHGPTGRGDGPLGVRLRPRPADFRIHMAAGHSDAQLFAWIADGVAGTGMPAFRGQLTADEIWHVANYIRSFAPPRQ
jgi:mono/diheme cytochrome c family protein/nitrogen fixation protein FixH